MARATEAEGLSRILPTLPNEILEVIIHERIRLDEERGWPFHCPYTSAAAQSVGTLSHAWAAFVRPHLFRRVSIRKANAASLCAVLGGTKDLPGKVRIVVLVQARDDDLRFAVKILSLTTGVESISVQVWEDVVIASLKSLLGRNPCGADSEC